MNLRLRPEQRLRNQHSIQEVFKRGSCVRGSLLNLWVWQTESFTKTKIAIVVSRKTALRANKRNLWKRRIREAFRLNQDRFLPGGKIIFQAKKREPVPSYLELETEILKLSDKAGMLNVRKN